jgi:Raf kinase inhibitor-like YbhB/YbcL family protein
VKRIAIFSVCAIVLVACSRDGRNLRPPGVNQNKTIVTAPPASSSTSAVAAIVPPKPSLGVAQPVFAAPWIDGQPIPADAGCKGTSPQLSWANVPSDITELAISMIDIDNGSAVHWVIAGLPPTIASIPAGAVPAGAVQTKNYLGTVGWAPPCPNSGTHTYLYTLYFLPNKSGVLATMSAENAISTLDLAAGNKLTVSGTATPL